MSIRDRVRDGGILQRLRRDPDQGWIAGVCAGLAEFFDWNVKLVRLVFAAALIFGGFFPAGVIYLVLWYLVDPVEDGTQHSSRSRHADSSSPTSCPMEIKLRFARLEERLRNMEACVASRDFELRRELKKLEG